MIRALFYNIDDWMAGIKVIGKLDVKLYDVRDGDIRLYAIEFNATSHSLDSFPFFRHERGAN